MNGEARYKLDQLCDAIIADINEMGGEQIMVETAGEDFDEVAQSIRDLFVEIVLHHKRRAEL